MRNITFMLTVPALLLTASLIPVAAQAPAILERSNEVRFQLDFKVPDAALAAVMPKGFSPDVATTGPAKDCNVRVIFIDRVTVNGPDNAGLGKGRREIFAVEMRMSALARKAADIRHGWNACYVERREQIREAACRMADRVGDHRR